MLVKKVKFVFCISTINKYKIYEDYGYTENINKNASQNYNYMPNGLNLPLFHSVTAYFFSKKLNIDIYTFVKECNLNIGSVSGILVEHLVDNDIDVYLRSYHRKFRHYLEV